MRYFGGAVAWVLGTIALIVAVFWIGYGMQWWFAPYQGKLEQRQQVNSGSFRIEAYEHFYNICAGIQTDETRLEAQYLELKGTKDADDRDRIMSNIAGITADRADGINQYNADARKAGTVGQFRSSDLPFQLDSATFKVGGTRTSCTA